MDKYKDEDYLKRKLIDEKMTMKELANELGENSGTIQYWRDKFGMKQLYRQSHGLSDKSLYQNKDWLKEKYVDEQMTCKEIAEICNSQYQTIGRWLDKHGIGKRSPKERARLRYGEKVFLQTQDGYERWQDSISGKNCFVHQLVAVANGEDPYKVWSNNEYQIHHKNGVRWDNRHDNIELLHSTEHSSRHGEHGVLL